MKKLVTAACALAAGLALADGVESANIVGYQQVTLTEQFTILGVNFTAVNGSDISLQDAIPYATGMTKGNKVNEADQIQIQDGAGGYNTYFMSNGLNAKGNKTIDGLEGKWTTAAGSESYKPVTASIPAGAGAWFIRNGNTDFVITIARPFTIE